MYNTKINFAIRSMPESGRKMVKQPNFTPFVFFGMGCILLLMVGCNPMRRIDMKNASGGDVEITWKLNDRDSSYKSDFFISNSKTLSFNLKPEKPLNEVNMTFGIGSWKPEDLALITERLEALKIKSPAGTIELKSPEEIYAFLANRRKGITKRKIMILVKN